MGRNKQRLPQTTELLAQVTETYEDIAFRRLDWAVNEFMTSATVPTKYQLIKFASLHSYKDRIIFQKAIDQALTQIDSEVNRK